VAALAREILRADRRDLAGVYKKASGKPTVSYDHAVEKALCFGWIDGMVKEAGPRMLRATFYAQEA